MGEAKRRLLLAQAAAERRAAGELEEEIAPPPKPLKTPGAMLASDARGAALLAHRVRRRMPLASLFAMVSVLGVGLDLEPPEDL